MKYNIEKQERYSIFTLEEENLNSLLAPDLKAELVVMRNQGVPNLILDLSKVKYVDSSGLGSILVGNRLWKDLGSFILTGIEHPSVQKLIEISRLSTVLSIIATRQESIDYVLMEELERDLRLDDTSKN